MEHIILKQFDANGRGLDTSRWLCNPYELHILMYDVMIIGCVRFEVTKA